ncbi:MAG: hypothetical protein ACSHYA_16415 [Opitutaceae bacterium]
MKTMKYLLCFILITSIGYALDIEKKPFIEHAKAVHDFGENTIALVRVKKKTSSYIDFELIEVLVGTRIIEQEFRAYADPNFRLNKKHSDEGTEWILDFFKLPVKIEGQTEKRMCYSAMNALRSMKGLVYGQITETRWNEIQEMTIKELRTLLEEKISKGNI